MGVSLFSVLKANLQSQISLRLLVCLFILKNRRKEVKRKREEKKGEKRSKEEQRGEKGNREEQTANAFMLYKF